MAAINTRAAAGVAALMFFSGLAFGLTSLPASAEHYHDAGYCGAGNGMVQGSSTTDGAYHARVEFPSACPANYKYCANHNYYWSGPGVTDESRYETCNAFKEWSGSFPECAGWAHVYYEAVFGYHNHYAHNRCI